MCYKKEKVFILNSSLHPGFCFCFCYPPSPPPSAPLSSAWLSVWFSQVTESGLSLFSLSLSLALVRLDMANPLTLPTPVQGSAIVMLGWFMPMALVSEQTPGIPGHKHIQTDTDTKTRTHTVVKKKKNILFLACQTGCQRASCWYTKKPQAREAGCFSLIIQGQQLLQTLTDLLQHLTKSG